jgi:hypothetical protein
MAWIYLAESLETVSLSQSTSITSLTVNQTDTLRLSSFQECQTGDFQEHQYAQISVCWMYQNSEEKLISFAPDFPARISAVQARVRDWEESEAVFFSRSFAWPKKYSPLSYSLKTCQRSEQGDWIELSRNLPRWGMTFGGQCYPLQKLGLRTKENAGSCWATPVADDSVERVQGKWNSRGEPKLSAQVRLWPTPRAADGSQNQRTLEGVKKEISRKGAPQDLVSAVRLQTPNGGQLNPTWTEWLMGFPIGWTELNALGMQWFPCKQKRLLKCS